MSPRATSVEYSLVEPGDRVDAWVTVAWGPDDQLQVYIGKANPAAMNRAELARAAQTALRKLASEFSELVVKGSDG